MFTLNANNRLLTVDKPLIMGIINSTPDSFYEGSRFSGEDGILKQAERMLKEGAAIIDIGGQSTRPGSEKVEVEEELNRVIPAIQSLHYNFPAAVISVDTYYSAVAKKAVKAGAAMINDIGGGNLDKDMITVAGQLKVPYICMHLKGNPSNMHQLAEYEDITREITDYFIYKIKQCREAGVHDLILDPGIGFAKTASHNFRLIKDLNLFRMLEKPLLAGISRKGMIYRTLGITADEALNGSTAMHMACLMNGADILRVHDVKAAMEVVKLYLELR